MKTVKVINGQTISDIAVQNYGCLEGIVQLATDNPLIKAFEQILKPGTELLVQDTPPALNNLNVALANFFNANGVEVSSGTNKTPGRGGYIIGGNNFPLLGSDGQPILITPSIHPIVTNNNSPILTDDGLSINTH